MEMSEVFTANYNTRSLNGAPSVLGAHGEQARRNGAFPKMKNRMLTFHRRGRGTTGGGGTRPLVSPPRGGAQRNTSTGRGN
jgi:hypothetical protein